MKLKVFHENEWREYPAKTYAEYTYEWLGEPHESASIKLDSNGNEVARNHVRDPRFVSGDWRSLLTNPVYGGWENGYGVELRRNQGGASNRTGFFFTLDEYVSGEAVTVSFDAQRVVDGGNFRAMILDSADNENRSVVMAITTERDRYVVHLGDDLDFNRVYLDFLNNEDPGPGGTIGYLDRVIVEPGHTDGSYFGGDTLPSRAWVDLQPRNISGIKRIWPRSSTPPPAGTHYAWLGEPHDSESVKLDPSGAEVARNPIRGFQGWMGASDSNAEYISGHHIKFPRAGTILEHYLDVPEGATSVQYYYWIRGTEKYSSANGDLTGLHSTFYRDDTFSISKSSAPNDGEWHLIEKSYSLDNVSEVGMKFNSSGNWSARDVELKEVQVTFDNAPRPDFFDGSTESDRAHDLWYNSEGVPHEWVNGQGWTEL